MGQEHRGNRQADSNPDQRRLGESQERTESHGVRDVKKENSDEIQDH